MDIEVIAEIKGIEFPKQEKLDLSPVLEEMKTLKLNLDKADITSAIESVSSLEKLLTKRVPEIEKIVGNVLSLAKESFIFSRARDGVTPRKKFKGFSEL